MIRRALVLAVVGLGVASPAASAVCSPKDWLLGDHITFSCPPGPQLPFVPFSSTTTFELWGASGGSTAAAAGGLGGHVTVTFGTPEAPNAIRLSVGTMGAVSAGGAGGGGAGGSGGGAGGGGATSAVRTTSPSSASFYAYAGGGGGAGGSASTGAGGTAGAVDGNTGTAGGGGAGGGAGTLLLGGTGANGGGGGWMYGASAPPGQPYYQGGSALAGSLGGGGGAGFSGGGGGGAGGEGGGSGSSQTDGGGTFVTASGPGDGLIEITFNISQGYGFASSPNTTTFTEGEPGTFTITTLGGFDTPTITIDPSFTLPAGLGLVPNGDGTATITGTPAPGTAAATPYIVPLGIHTANSASTQGLELTIDPVPAPPAAASPPPTWTAPPDEQTFPPAPPADSAPAAETSQADPAPPEPRPGETVVVAPTQGTIVVRRPDGELTVLRAGEAIPVGSVVDARRGTVSLTAARDARGTQQTASFSGAIFRVTQQADAAGNRVTELTLTQVPTGCGAGGRAHAAAAPKGLWGDGKGSFRTRGRYSAATVRGTRWYVEDRCDGTYTRVARGVVRVRDYTRARTVSVRAGHTYLARPPRRAP